MKINKKESNKMWCFSRIRDERKIVSEEIFWQGPFSWPGYEDKNRLGTVPDIHGIYLLTFSYRQGYVLYAAGITNSTKQRFSTHTREYRKGNYNVLDIDLAEKGERKEIWHGWNYAKTHKEEFQANKETILKAVDKQLNSFKVFIAEVQDLRKRERIEAAIMMNVYNTKEHWAELADKGMFLKGRYNSEIPIILKNRCSNKIFGLPETLEV